VIDLNEFKYPDSFKGRYPGFFVLLILQFLVGAIHVTIGLSLVFAASGELFYSIYTFLYGILSIIFAFGLWLGKKSGYLGIIILSLFVIVVDTSTVLGVSLIAGVPRAAALGEIGYSLIIMSYLFQPKIISLFTKVS
jgi:hypothetical protein